MTKEEQKQRVAELKKAVGPTITLYHPQRGVTVKHNRTGISVTFGQHARPGLNLIAALEELQRRLELNVN
jgi:hypothetical protein